MQPPGQVLKLAQWDDFFDETHTLVKLHLPETDFFQTLASLMLQKLVKSVNPGKAISQENIAYLRSFAEGLSKNHSLTGKGSEHEEVLAGLAAAMNFGSAPGDEWGLGTGIEVI